MGTWDLHFNHHKKKEELKRSADMGCCICSSIYYKMRRLLENEPSDGDSGVSESSFSTVLENNRKF
jgi:hypothetical protein